MKTNMNESCEGAWFSDAVSKMAAFTGNGPAHTAALLRAKKAKEQHTQAQAQQAQSQA